MKDCLTCAYSTEQFFNKPCVDCEQYAFYESIPDIDNTNLIKLWTDAGGSFHGPITEMATIPANKLFELLRELTK